MPRPRKQQAAVHVSPGQASYVLDRLLAERRISHGEVNRYVTDMQREITDLEQRLQTLREASGSSGAVGRRPAQAAAARPAAAEGQAQQPAAKGRGRRRRRSAITPEQLASRQLQGRYLGLIRQIPASRRAQYQKTAKDRGREAAIKEMQTALKK